MAPSDGGRSIDALSAMPAGSVSELVKSFWNLPPEQGAKVVEDEVLFKRGWCWPTEGDAAAVLEISKYMVAGKIIEKPLAWAQVKGAFAQSQALLKEAYEKSGSKPPASAFEARDAADLRGKPAWEIAAWKDRS